MLCPARKNSDGSPTEPTSFELNSIRNDKAGRIPDECAPILERLECNAETRMDIVKNSRKRFRNEAGLPKNRTLFRTSRRQHGSSLAAS